MKKLWSDKKLTEITIGEALTTVQYFYEFYSWCKKCERENLSETWDSKKILIESCDLFSDLDEWFD